MKNKVFDEEYKKLNPGQLEAVEAIEGPVMVVAGPGTGKTQILALRIGNILEKTDTKADGVLCLTFTNSAVDAMKTRLERYIGETGAKVNVDTFHGFGMRFIEEHYAVLGLGNAPRLMDDTDTALIFDEILQNNKWTYLRPRSDNARYFGDLKSLISLLKRERISAADFLTEVEGDIRMLSDDPENISSRGESKGKFKKEILNKLESLERSKEVAKFINIYEESKKDRNALDYDDVLENLVKIIELSADAGADIRERYLYVLVDEHQDSSRVQNDFLKSVWGEVENPNLFVVGDDRQLIYGFSGASIDHFTGFKKTFSEARLITLVDNYRSTQIILDASHALLQSVMSGKKLQSHNREHFPIGLVGASFPDEEIIACGLDIKEKIKIGVDVNDCAILLPTNKQVRNALNILHSMGLPVATTDNLNFFDQPEARGFIRILKIISNPSDGSALALSLFDELASILPLEAHSYIAEHNMRQFSLSSLQSEISPTLFDDTSAVSKWIKRLSKWSEDVKNKNLIEMIEIIGQELFSCEPSDLELVSGKEILNTVLFLATKEIEKTPELDIAGFVSFLDRVESFNEKIPLVMDSKDGIKVLTLHSSKGLEFDYVWIAHMNERSLNSTKRMGLSLPKEIAAKIEEHDVDRIKRKLYVAITRAKRFCTLSYSQFSNKDSEQEVARVISELPEEVFEKRKTSGSFKKTKVEEKNYIPALVKLVAQKYDTRFVSASLLNNFYECPWKWYFSNLLGLPKLPMETFEFGIAVHASLETILKFPETPNKVEIEKIVFNIAMEGRFGTEATRQRIAEEVVPLIERWVKNRLPEIKLGRRTEEGISVKDERFPHLKIYGKIDLIENLGPKEVRVTDFKTGSVRKRRDIEKRDEEGRMSGNLRQLVMYSYLLRDNPKWATDARESRLEFLEAKNEKESFYEHVVTPTEVELLIKDIADYDESIKKGFWVDRICNYNSYGKNTGCEYCSLAEVFKSLQGPVVQPT